MTRTPQQIIGSAHEALACEYLQQQGLRLIQKNYLCRCGEIDLIMQERDTLVFVEVRFRRQNRFGSASESVTVTKQRKLIKTAQQYLQRFGKTNSPARFDVVAISGNGTDPMIDWIVNAFAT